jgi:hypothetical protein
MSHFGNISKKEIKSRSIQELEIYPFNLPLRGPSQTTLTRQGR